MQDLKLTENWDIDRSGGDLNFISGSEETAQNINIGILTIRTEYIFDRQLGMPWFSGMMGSNYLGIEREDELRRTILGREGPSKINEFFFKVDTIERTALVEYSVETLYGTSRGYIAKSIPEEL